MTAKAVRCLQRPRPPMKIKMKEKGSLIEKTLISAGTAVYLWRFNQIVPHGDALRIVRQIESSDLAWNPNHLIFDPIGYGFYFILKRCSFDIQPLACFELLSGIATIVSVMLFFQILVRSGVKSPVRTTAVIGFFASASFLALVGNQYYFMIQMPFLLGALHLYMDLLLKVKMGKPAPANLYGIGVLLAISSALMFNNLLVVLLGGVAVGFVHASWKRWEWKNTLRLYVAAAAVGFPMFIGGYLLSNATSSFTGWLLSYGGDAGSRLNDFYGLKPTLSGVLQGALKIGFNLMSGNIVEDAGLGTVLSVVFSGSRFEFTPRWSEISLCLASIPLAAVANLKVAGFIFRRFSTEPVVRYLAAWLFSYLAFNFLWDSNDAIFWVQTIPAIWLLLLLSLGAMSDPLLEVPNESNSARTSSSRRWKALAVFAAVLLFVNTTNLVVPLADRDYSQKQTRHALLLRDGDLEIIPGWDKQKWLILNENRPKVSRLVLMNMALAPPESDKGMSRLAELVRSHLAKGGRVIVARLFDIDDDLMPWYGLKRAGWPRRKIQDLLAPFCKSKIGQIEKVVFRELTTCDASNVDKKRHEISSR